MKPPPSARTRTLAAATLVLAATACLGDGPAGPTNDLHVDRVEILQGAGQTGVEGDTLPDAVVAAVILSNNQRDRNRRVYAKIRSGNGGMFIKGARAWGNGVTLSGTSDGTFSVNWILGPADEEQVLYMFAIGADTVGTEVHATVLPKEGS